MEWTTLLSKARLGKDASSTQDADRTEFQRDFDRIIFSSAFRRLQDKTQVFPLSQSDYVRTRLTHSLEASSVGRSLGHATGDQVLKKHPELNVSAPEFGSIVSAACLAHDIGNPPFGHSGEDAIRDWFENSSIGRQIIEVLELDVDFYDDFLVFEGNAQGFRTVTKLQRPEAPGGMQLTCATLAAFTKYPFGSVARGEKQKFGFFKTEVEQFEEIAQKLGLVQVEEYRYARHPLAYLVEAADDICYHVIDIEDGFRLNLLGFDEVFALFAPLLSQKQQNYLKTIPTCTSKMDYLRATTISTMVARGAAVFMDNEEAILAGSYHSTLMEDVEGASDFAQLKRVAFDKVYNSSAVVEIEAAAYEVIGRLLDSFGQSVLELHTGSGLTSRSKKALALLPESYRPAKEKDIYANTQSILDYISGMTDRFAVETFRKISGFSLIR